MTDNAQYSLSSDPLINNEDLVHEIKTRYSYAQKNMSEWEYLAREDMAFALGDQWTTEELTILKSQGRPNLTFNRIKPLINLISGYQRDNSSRIKVNPEGGEDKIFSEVMDRLIRHIDKISHMAYKMSYWFDDAMYTGKGWLEAVLTYEHDPVRGELRFLQRSPYQVLLDPDFNEYDLNEWPRAQYLFKVVRMTKDTIKMLYPKYEKLIDGFVEDNDDRIENGAAMVYSGTNDDYGNRPNVTTSVKRKPTQDESGLKQDEKFTIKEYWRIKSVKKYFVVEVESGEPRRFDAKDDAEKLILTQGSGKVIERKVPEIWVAAYVSGFVLQDDRSPFEPYYSGYPFFRFLSEWVPSAETEELKVQGMVRALKDPQREKNKALSQTLHILNTQANSGWIGDSDALTPEGWKNLEEMGSKPGITVKKRRGSDLREIQPKGPNIGHLEREQKADNEFKQISGINPDLLGFQEHTASGKAISMRIRQAVTSLVRIFHNYRFSKEIIGKFLLEMVPKIFDEKKIKKVLGPKYMAEAVDPQRYPEGLQDGHLAAFLKMVDDNKYDVFVSEADANKTVRYEIFQDLTSLAKVYGPLIPVQLIIDYMDLPNSEEVKQQIMKQQAQLAAQAQAQAKTQAKS